MKLNLKEHYFSVSKCGMFKFCTTVCKCGMLHKSLKCVIFQALAGLLVYFSFNSNVLNYCHIFAENTMTMTMKSVFVIPFLSHMSVLRV